MGCRALRPMDVQGEEVRTQTLREDKVKTQGEDGQGEKP